VLESGGTIFPSIPRSGGYANGAKSLSQLFYEGLALLFTIHPTTRKYRDRVYRISTRLNKVVITTLDRVETNEKLVDYKCQARTAQRNGQIIQTPLRDRFYSCSRNRDGNSDYPDLPNITFDAK
jgi:hypothetical protein